MHRQDCQGVGADFADQVSIGRDAVGTNHDPADIESLHEMRCSRIHAEQRRDALMRQLPGSEPSALQSRPGFGDIDSVNQPGAMGRADHAQRSTITAGAQRTGIGVGHEVLRALLMATNQLCPQPSHGQVGLHVAVVNGPCSLEQFSRNVFVPSQALQPLTQYSERPDKMHCARPRRFQHAKICRQGLLPVLTDPDLSGRQRDSVRCSNTHGSRPLDCHVTDGGGNDAGILTVEIHFLGREPALVEQRQRAPCPLDGPDLGFARSLILDLHIWLRY